MGYVKRHIAIYGNVSLQRGYCTTCKTTCIILDNEKQCCGENIKKSTLLGEMSIKRVSSPRYKRRKVSKEEKLRILNIQNYKCIYCEMSFGSLYVRGRGERIHRTVVHYDHFIPFTYSANNKNDNIVASCNLCNMVKSDKIFNSIEEARDYVIKKNEKKGVTFI